MAWIVAGLALWWGAHLFGRLAPGARARLGDPGKGLVALAVVAAIVLMVIGYGGSDALGVAGAEMVNLWFPPAFLTHLNNLLMLLAVYLFAASALKTRLTRVIRHPQLIGFKTWAVGHLLVNGDLASLVLFGGLLAWAVVAVILLNRAGPRPAPNPPAALGREIGAVAGTLVGFGAISLVHVWLGVWPFG